MIFTKMLNLLILASLAIMLSSKTANAAYSCNYRCSYVPGVLDHLYPSGCYCHSSCGGKLRCCRDKARYCGDPGGGSQECTIPKTVRNADIVGGGKVHYGGGESITYECRYHYEMSGSATRTCTGNGIWRPGPPSCKYVIYVCRPPKVSNGDHSYSKGPVKKQYVNYDVVEISCKSGYIMKGESSLTCSYYSWKPYPPSCIKDRCATMKCYNNEICHNFQYYARCLCKKGFQKDGWKCSPIPCYKHTCSSDEVCVDSGDETGDYECECKDGLMRNERNCIADPCHSNNCHASATCSVVDSTSCQCNEGFKGNGTFCEPDPCHEKKCHANATCLAVDATAADCECNKGFAGNGTFCEPAACNPGIVYGDEVVITGICEKCFETCCDPSMLRECRICMHMECNDGEVCGEVGLSRVETVCIDKECWQNEGGLTVDTPDSVHCLDENGLQLKEKSCCWTGE